MSEQKGWDIGFADSNAAGQSTGFSFIGGGKNNALTVAFVVVGVIVAGALGWLWFKKQK